jgi:hypothetical protein
MVSPVLGRLNWNCFNLLTGASSPPATGAAEAMRNKQDNNVRIKANHLGYIAKVATFEWGLKARRRGTWRAIVSKNPWFYRSITPRCGRNSFCGTVSRASLSRHLSRNLYFSCH